MKKLKLVVVTLLLVLTPSIVWAKDTNQENEKKTICIEERISSYEKTSYLNTNLLWATENNKKLDSGYIESIIAVALAALIGALWPVFSRKKEETKTKKKTKSKK